MNIPEVISLVLVYCDISLYVKPRMLESLAKLFNILGKIEN